MKKFFTTVLFVSGILNMASAQVPNWVWAIGDSSSTDWENGIGISGDNSGHLYLDARSGTMTWGGKTVTTGCPGGYANNPISAEFDTSGRAVWIKSNYYNECANDYTEGFYRDNYDNSYSTGILGSNNYGMFVNKFDKDGNLKWALSFESVVSAEGLGVAADNDGNVYVTGTMGSGNMTVGSVTISYSGSSNAIFLFKLDSTGNCIWGKSIYGAGAADGYDRGRDIIVDNKGFLYFLGDYNGSPNFSGKTVPTSPTDTANFFLAKYDTAGNSIWVNTVSRAIANYFGGTNSIVVDTCGNLYFAGTCHGTSQFVNSTSGGISLTSSGGTDVFLARCDNNGKWEYAVNAGSPGDDAAQSVTIDKNSDIYIGGTYAPSNTINFGNGVTASGGNVFIAKFSNGNGAAQWAQSASADGVFGITIDKSNHIYIVGSISGTNAIHAFGSHNVQCYSTQNLYIAKLDTASVRAIVPGVDSVYCPGAQTTMLYTVSGTFNNGNVFTAQLSDSTGSFYNPKNIGSVSSTGSGSINITIPDNATPGNTYLIRIISSNPSSSSYYNGCGAYLFNSIYPDVFYVTIGAGSATEFVSPDTSICAGSFADLHATGGNTYLWTPGATLNDSTSANPIAVPSSTQIYTVTATNGCGNVTKMVKVTVNPASAISVNPDDTTVCAGTSVVLQASGSASYTWTPATGLTCATCANPTATPLTSITYTVTGNGGTCSKTITVPVNVGDVAVGGNVAAVRDTLCQGTSGNLSLSGNSSNTIQWQSSPDDINYTSLPGDTLSHYKTPPLEQSTWYHALVGSGNCSAVSDSLELIVPPVLTAYFNFSTTSTTNQLSFNSDSSAGSIRSYHWDFGDGQTSSEQNPQHTFATDSTYYVCLTLYDGSNCSYTFCRYSGVAEGVPAISAAGNWVIYPNPFENQLAVSPARAGQLAMSSKIQSIEMYDVLGRVVINEDLDNTTNTSLQLDVSSLAKGMYFIMLRTVDAGYVQKVVKQ